MGTESVFSGEMGKKRFGERKVFMMRERERGRFLCELDCGVIYRSGKVRGAKEELV